MSSVADEILLTRIARTVFGFPAVSERKFRIKTCESITETLSIPVAVLEIPEGGAVNTLLTKFSGNTRRIVLNFIAAAGACSVDGESGIVASRDLIAELKTNFEPISIIHKYTLQTVSPGTSTVVNPINHAGFIENMQIQLTPRDDPTNWVVTLTFVEGFGMENLLLGIALS